MTEFKFICATLVLIFSIEDLVGSDRIQKIEKRWLEIASNIFIKWRGYFSKFIRIVQNLMFLFVSLVCTYSVVLLIFYLIWKSILYVIKWIEQFTFEWIYYLATYFFMIFTYLIFAFVSVKLNFILPNLFNVFVTKDYYYLKLPLFEYRMISSFYKTLSKLNYVTIKYSDPSTIPKSPTTDKNKIVLASSIMSSFFGLMSILVVLIFTISVVLRITLTVMAFALWIGLFGIPNVLSKISKYTGNKSYFKAGKYILSLIIYIIAWMFD
jgi:hypothetical protein